MKLHRTSGLSNVASKAIHRRSLVLARSTGIWFSSEQERTVVVADLPQGQYPDPEHVFQERTQYVCCQSYHPQGLGKKKNVMPESSHAGVKVASRLIKPNGSREYRLEEDLSKPQMYALSKALMPTGR
jgi:hypothetical protein